MTPEERAKAVYRNATGPINITRYACESLESEIAAVVRAAIDDEREACAQLTMRLEIENYGLAPMAVREAIAAAIRARGQ